MYIWTKFNINYVFIFEFDARHHVRYQHIFEVFYFFFYIK